MKGMKKGRKIIWEKTLGKQRVRESEGGRERERESEREREREI